MKQRITLTGLCLSLLISSSYAVSLRDSVEKAINTNPDIIAEKKNQEAYRKYVDDREGLYLPTLDIESYLEKNRVKKDYDDDSGLTDTNTTEDGYNAAIIFRQYLYDGGSTPAQVAEVKHQELANKHRSFYAIENTILETVKAYTGLVQSDEKLALTYDMIKNHEENLVTAKEKEEISGEVLETYQVSSKLNFTTDKYIEEQDTKESGIAQYIKYVGEEPLGKICRPAIDETKVPATLKDAIELAVLRNHRVLEQIERIKLQREKIAQYDARFLPSLNLELKASIDDDLELDEQGTQKDRYARLNLNWNLFNGNRDNIRSEQETIFLQEQKKTLDEITNDVVAEIKSLYSKFYKNKKRVEALKKYVVANVNIVEVYRNEFEAGTRTFVDILDAESELYNSSTSLINMEYAALNNYYDLMFNLSQLTDTVLSAENQICDNVAPRVLDYTPKAQDKQSTSELDGLISNADSSIISEELGLDTEVTETASSDAMKMATSEYKTFLDAPKSYYTINIATKNGMAAASKYIKDNNLGDDAYAFEFGPSMKSAKILYGVYSSVKEAKAAMKSLGSSVLANKPYIDNISKHQALFAKYN